MALAGAVIAICAVLLPTFLRGRGTMLLKIGEQAALFSAAFSMPDAGLALLRERLRPLPPIYGSELYEGSLKPEGAEETTRESAWPSPQTQATDQEKAPSTPSTPTANSPRRPVQPTDIPQEYAGPVIAENFAGYDEGAWVRWRNGYIKNDTRHNDEQVLAILEQEWATTFENIMEPQVLILHTHATESYELFDRDSYDTRNTWRSTDNTNNMVAVGDAMAAVLNENGIGVLHDTTQHDYPSYNGSYERSAETIKQYLADYPSIKVVLDLHRDAIQRADAIVKPVAMIEGQKAAQIMIIAACDDGEMGIPNWRENWRFAALFQDTMEQFYPELTKPAFFCYRKYNMDLTPGSLLLEFGSNANTLEEAVYSAQLAGQALSYLIWSNVVG